MYDRKDKAIRLYKEFLPRVNKLGRARTGIVYDRSSSALKFTNRRRQEMLGAYEL